MRRLQAFGLPCEFNTPEHLPVPAPVHMGMPGVLRETADSITYGRTRSDRTKMLVVAGFFGCFALWGLWMTIDPERFGPNIQADRGAGAMALLVLGFFASWCVVLSLGQEIELFPKKKTYRFKSGSKAAEGSYDDLVGLVLICRNGRAGPLRWIRLRFRNGLSDVPMFFSYSDADARAELDRLAHKLELPVSTSDT